jgi:hypothetical protein
VSPVTFPPAGCVDGLLWRTWMTPQPICPLTFRPAADEVIFSQNHQYCPSILFRRSRDVLAAPGSQCPILPRNSVPRSPKWCWSSPLPVRRRHCPLKCASAARSPLVTQPVARGQSVQCSFSSQPIDRFCSRTFRFRCRQWFTLTSACRRRVCCAGEYAGRKCDNAVPCDTNNVVS